MVSAPTALLTMDFSMMPLDHGVVDSPPKARNHAQCVRSPPPLKNIRHGSSCSDGLERVDITQRKLYKEEIILMKSPEVLYISSMVFSFNFSLRSFKCELQTCISNIFFKCEFETCIHNTFFFDLLRYMTYLMRRMMSFLVVRKC